MHISKEFGETERTLLSALFAPIMETGTLSIGRLILLSSFVLAMIQWAHGVEIGQSHLTILLTMIGYIFGNKVIGNAKDAITKVTEIRAAIKAGVEGKPVPSDNEETDAA